MSSIALLSDVHLRSTELSTLRTELEAYCDVLLAEQPDHLFVLGDLIEDGASPETDREHVQVLSDTLNTVPCPVTCLLGNHDVENLSCKALSSLLGQDQFHGVREVGNTPVIFLNSTREQKEGACGEYGLEQRRWLAECLSQYDAPLILSHHPLGNFNLSDNEWFNNFPERAFPVDRRELLVTLKTSRATPVTFCGHIHQTGFSTFHEVPHISLNAFSKETPEKSFTGTHAIVTVDETVTVDVKIRDKTVATYQV